MAKFSVWYERPEYYEVEVEAETEQEAEAKAEAIIGSAADMSKFYSCQGEVEYHMTENHTERTRTFAGGMGEDMEG